MTVEGQLTALMARTMILPAALRYQAEVADGGDRDQGGRRRELGAGRPAEVADGHHHDFQKATTELDHALAHHAEGEPLAHAKHSRDKVLPAMTAVRALGDKLETVVADDLWPLPTYREMLFIK